MSSYHIKVTHTAPTFEQFEEWGVERAFPNFYITITFYKAEKEEFSFRVKVTGHYYCCGSRNFEDISFSLDTCQINNKKQVDELLDDPNIMKILEESIEKSIKNSMIPNDPIGILELYLFLFFYATRKKNNIITECGARTRDQMLKRHSLYIGVITTRPN